jgi:hypothetical protein
MPLVITFKASQVTWDGNTWDTATNGGPIEVSYAHSGRIEENRVGDNVYPTVVATPDKSCVATVTLREVKQTLDLGDVGADMVMTVSGKGVVTQNITLAGMVLVDVGAVQRRGEFGAVVLRFAHESADGTTVPIS